MTAERDPSRRADTEWIPNFVTIIGALLLLVYIGEQTLLYENQTLQSGEFLVEFLASMVFIVPLLAGGYLLARNDLPTKRYPRIVKWILGGLGFFLAVNLLIMMVSSFADFSLRISWSRWAASVGAAVGLLVGYTEARAIQRELEAQRAAIRADEAENQRRWLDYLNGLLRHEVLNTANVIVGYASLLLEDNETDFDDATRAQLETINRQGENMTKVIRDVQVLIEATSDITRFEPVDLSNTLDGELNQLRDSYESVTVETSIPDDVTVLADELLPRIFSNILRNAVEHNDSNHPEVRITVEQNDDAATIQIADNGSGVPKSERETLFERGDNTGAKHGLGLYLVRTLVERYSGTVELTKTGADGSIFTVELPIAKATADRDSADRGRAERSPANSNHAESNSAADGGRAAEGGRATDSGRADASHEESAK